MTTEAAAGDKAKETIMTRSSIHIMAVVVVAVGLAWPAIAIAQQVGTPTNEAVRVAQPTRSYRSYSVSPVNGPRGEVRRTGPHGGDATWRHAGAKPAGHYGSGR